MNKSLKVGIFIPPPVDSGKTASIHSAGIGRLPLETHKKLTEMVKHIEGHEISLDLNFRKSIIVNGKVYVDDFCLNDLDIYFWYCEVDRNIGSYDLDILKTLAKDIKVVPNPYGFEIGLDKYWSHEVLRRSGVSVADTILFDSDNLSQIQRILDNWGKVLLKPRRGGFGKGVTLINNYSALRDFIDYIQSTTGENPDKAYLLEKYYYNDPKGWTSTTFINNELIYGYRKRATRLVDMGDGAFKVYDANEIGGEVDSCHVPQEFRLEAFKAFAALRTEVIGFDMICHNSRPIIVDENTFPGYYEEIFKEIGRDSAEVFLKLITDEINKLDS